MLNDFAIARELPEKARRPYRVFLVAYGLSVAVLGVLFIVVYYTPIVDGNAGDGAAVPAAFMGLVMTAMLGGTAVRCIRDVARAFKSGDEDIRSRK